MHISNFKLDEFMKLSYEPFILKRESTNLLNTILSEEVSRIIVSKFFIESIKSKGKRCLKTEFHLNWAMECIGFSFSMPIEESSTISQAIKIYKDWLLTPAASPDPFKENVPFYHREIINHLSLIFSKKKNPQKHSDLCSEVLNIIKIYVRTQTIDLPTWEYLMQIMLLITNQVLKNYTKLSEFIGSKVLKVFFEIWLRSSSRNEQLWSQVKASLSCWIDHICLINHWTTVVTALTKPVLALVYFDGTTQLEVIFDKETGNQEASDVIRLDLAEEHIIYLWYRFLVILMNETLTAEKMRPDVHAALVKAVSNVVDLILKVCIKRITPEQLVLTKIPIRSDHNVLVNYVRGFYNSHFNYGNGLSRIPMPSINGILAIFGQWLFFHAKLDPVYDVFGKSEATSVLCRVFSIAQGPASKRNTQAFFSTLAENILNGDGRVVGQILKSCTDLVSFGPSALQFLNNPNAFIHHLEIYLCEKDTEISIRKPCYTILSTIIALPNLYKLLQLSKSMRFIVLEALKIETDSDNFNTLVWSMCVFASTITEDQDLLHNILCAMVDRLGQINYKDKRMYSDLLEVVSIVPYLINRNIIAGQLAKRNIENIHAFIPKRGKSIEDDQSSGLLIALNNWLSCFPFVLELSDLRFDILRILENRRNIEKYQNFSDCIKSNIFNNLKRPYHAEPGVNLHSALHSKGSGLRKDYTYCSSLISFHQQNLDCRVNIRNASGIYAWKLQMISPERPKELKISLPVFPINKKSSKKTHESSNIADELINTLSDREKSILSKQSKFFKTHKDLKPQPKEIRKPSAPEPQYTSAIHRIFLSQLGMLEYENLCMINSLSQDDAQSLASRLDNIPEKEVIVMPLFYISMPEEKEKSIMSCHDAYSKEFNQLLIGLGCVLSEEKLWLKHFENQQKMYEKVLYKNHGLFEVVTVSPALGGKGKRKGFEEYIAPFSLVVLWNQRMNDIYSLKKPNIIEKIDLQKVTVILLTVISLSLVKVNVIGKYNKTGPLIDQMVIPNVVLPKLLQFTMYNFKTTNKRYMKSWEKKTSLLNDKLTARCSLESILNYLFN